jgi:adenosylcobinamide-GDP ribazoletransferase
MEGIMRQLKSILGFLTIIPVNGAHGLREVARSAWLFPAVGLLLGLAAGFAGQLLSLVLPWSIASVASLFALLLLTGFHHLDGLLDFGDALLVRGTYAQRRRVMHSPGIGAGAFGLGAMVILITYLALAQSQNLITALIIAESSAKFSMLLTAFFGVPPWKGMGNNFVLVVKEDKRILLLGFVLYLLLVGPLAQAKMPFILLVVFIFPFLIARFSRALIGGVNGDVLGATNEISRMLVLVVLL